MHRAAVSGDSAAMDDAMNALYNHPSSPIALEGVARPETFAPIVEACALSIIHNHDALANDMFANVEYLRRGFGITKKEYNVIHDALQACKDRDIETAQVAIEIDLSTTSLATRVKLHRHTHF